jgi:hypothetical protein
VATNFLGATYFETANGDLATSTQNPYWVFGTKTKINGWLGPSDPSGLFSNTWQDSIALDSTTYSGFDDPQHPRAFVPGQTYHIQFVFYNFEHVSLKIESDTYIIKQYSIDNYAKYTLDFDLTAGSAKFFNLCLNGWGRDAYGNLADVRYEVTITGLTQDDKPDLTDTLSSLGATTVVAGQRLLLNHTLFNRGTVDVASQKFAVYLSTDAIVTSSDIFLGELTTGQLKAGAAQAFSTSTLALPGSVLPATYFVGIIADHNGAIAERNETNNVSNALKVVVSQADPTTGLAVSQGLGANLLPATAGDHEQYATPAFHFDPVTRLWSVVKNGATLFRSATKSSAQAIYDFLADEAVEEAEDLAGGWASKHVPGGKVAFDAWKISQPAVSFYQSTKTFFDKTWTRLEQAFVDADPTNPNLDASFDVVAVENDLKQYVKENMDRIIGLPVNAALDFAEDVVNGVTALFQHSDLSARIDVNINPGTASHLLTGANGHRNIMAGSQNAEQLRGGNGSDVVYGAAGNDTLLGYAGGDVVIGGDGNDRLAGGDGNDVVSGGLGVDFITGDAGNDKLIGGDGADALIGGSGADRIFGNSGQDVIIGGPGIDILVGGAGNDFFLFNAPRSSANHDVITDFSNLAGNNDTFRLENAVLAGLGAAGPLSAGLFRAGGVARDANDRIIYSRVTGELSYDGNGVAAGGIIHLATLTNKPLLTAADFVVI